MLRKFRDSPRSGPPLASLSLHPSAMRADGEETGVLGYVECVAEHDPQEVLSAAGVRVHPRAGKRSASAAARLDASGATSISSRLLAWPAQAAAFCRITPPHLIGYAGRGVPAQRLNPVRTAAPTPPMPPAARTPRESVSRASTYRARITSRRASFATPAARPPAGSARPAGRRSSCNTAPRPRSPAAAPPASAWA